MTPDEPGYHRLLANEIVRLKESDADYRAAWKLWEEHITGCNQCNYDLNCTACNAGFEKERSGHACNCRRGGGIGFELEQKMIVELNRIKNEAQRVVDEV